MYHYVYKIIDLKYNVFYIGSRSSKLKPKDDLGKIYFSSSDRDFIRRQKQNPDDFKYVILNQFDSDTEAYKYENELISENNSKPNCINGGVKYVHKQTALSYAAKDIIKYLGSLIRLTRKEMKITETDLAERVNISRATLQKVESGITSVAIGTYFEAAVVLGIPLLGTESKRKINRISTLMCEIHPLFSERTRGTIIEVDDDF